jgi:hypothetical protein
MPTRITDDFGTTRECSAARARRKNLRGKVKRARKEMHRVKTALQASGGSNARLRHRYRLKRRRLHRLEARAESAAREVILYC